MQKHKVTILILDYLKAPQVVQNVESLNAQNTDFDYDIVVIDNSCNAENSMKLSELGRHTNVSLVINNKNLGYIRAHNSVNHMIRGDYVLIVNPDIEWRDSDSLQKLIDYMDDNQDVGILGPKQYEGESTVAMSVRAFPKFYVQVARRTFLRCLPILKKQVEYDEMRYLDYDKVQDVDWLQSSCVLIRHDLWQDIGGFNDDYFLFMADAEICWEVWSRGKRVVYYPDVIVWADGKRCSQGGFAKLLNSWVLRQHVVDSFRYRFKYFGKDNPRLLFNKER